MLGTDRSDETINVSFVFLRCFLFLSSSHALTYPGRHNRIDGYPGRRIACARATVEHVAEDFFVQGGGKEAGGERQAWLARKNEHKIIKPNLEHTNILPLLMYCTAHGTFLLYARAHTHARTRTHSTHPTHATIRTVTYNEITAYEDPYSAYDTQQVDTARFLQSKNNIQSPHSTGLTRFAVHSSKTAGINCCHLTRALGNEIFSFFIHTAAAEKAAATFILRINPQLCK